VFRRVALVASSLTSALGALASRLPAIQTQAAPCGVTPTAVAARDDSGLLDTQRSGRPLDGPGDRDHARRARKQTWRMHKRASPRAHRGLL